MIRWYLGNSDQALGAFTADAAEAARHGFAVGSQAWMGDRLVVYYVPTKTRTVSIAKAIIGSIGAVVLLLAGLEMLGLRSVSGDTVAEAFDQAMGLLAIGLAVVSFGWAVTD